MNKLKRFIRLLKTSPWPGATMLAVGALGASLTYVFTSAPNKAHPGDTAVTGWWSVLVILFGVVGALGIAALIEWLRLRAYISGDRQEKVRRLTESLKEALTAIQAIQGEIEEGQRVLELLQSQTRAQKELASLTREEAAAVEDTLGRLLRRSGILRDIIIMLLGVGIGYALNHFLGH